VVIIVADGIDTHPHQDEKSCNRRQTRSSLSAREHQGKQSADQKATSALVAKAYRTSSGRETRMHNLGFNYEASSTMFSVSSNEQFTGRSFVVNLFSHFQNLFNVFAFAEAFRSGHNRSPDGSSARQSPRF
jgi:hypothetical protein